MKLDNLGKVYKPLEKLDINNNINNVVNNINNNVVEIEDPDHPYIDSNNIAVITN